MAQQTVLPWPERLDGAHFRAVRAGDGPVQRQRGLVGPAAIPALPASRIRVHNAPSRPARDFSLDASRLRCRPSASPQSPAPEAEVVALPTSAGWSAVQWRRVRPALERTDGSRAGASIAWPEVFESSCRYWIPMRYPLSAETGAGTRLGSGVGPSEGVGNSEYTRPRGHPVYAAVRSRRARARSRTDHARAHDPRVPSLRDLNLSGNNDWTRRVATRFGERP